MGSAVGNSTLDEVQEDELPEAVGLSDLTPIEDATRTLRGLFRGFTKFDDTYLVGEVGDLSPHSDHLYFSVEGAHTDAKLQCVVWESRRGDLDVEIEPDMIVAVSGEVTFFEKGGYPSLEVSEAHLVGESAYWQRVEQLRAELGEEGLFDPDRKDSLPRYPGTVGLVTAAGSDAEQDLIESIHNRYPDVNILVHDSTVQGSAAPAELTTGIRAIDDSSADVLVVSRGGGSDTSLRTFNEETVVRAIADAETPTVSAIGHEADEPLVDEVADVRVKTPTAAGEAVVADKEARLEAIDEATESVRNAYATQVYRWLHDERDGIDTAYEALCDQWVDVQRTAIETAQSNLVDGWIETAERDVQSAYAGIASDWVATQRRSIRQETNRIEREHTFEREKSGLRRRNAVLFAVVVALLVLLLVVLAMLFGFI